MLIIFDLDDTLIQTSRTFTPYQLKNAVVKMVEAGLKLPNMEEAIDQIQRMDVHKGSAKETLSEFLEIHGGDQKFYSTGYQAIYDQFTFSAPLLPMEQAQEILSRLCQNHWLALVTAGNEANQRAKLENAGIDSTLFSKIIVCEKDEKGIYYQELIREFRVSPQNVIVCGDRILWDLTPAKKMGMQTVLMRRGRGKNEPAFHRDVDVSVRTLNEFNELIEGAMIVK